MISLLERRFLLTARTVTFRVGRLIVGAGLPSAFVGPWWLVRMVDMPGADASGGRVGLVFWMLRRKATSPPEGK